VEKKEKEKEKMKEIRLSPHASERRATGPQKPILAISLLLSFCC
jgi:hypothetical protein